jgi:hypothetical protein
MDAHDCAVEIGFRAINADPISNLLLFDGCRDHPKIFPLLDNKASLPSHFTRPIKINPIRRYAREFNFEEELR